VRWNTSNKLYIAIDSAKYIDSDIADFLNRYWEEKVRPFYVDYDENRNCCKLFKRDSKSNCWVFLKGHTAKKYDITSSSIHSLTRFEQVSLAENIIPRAYNIAEINKIFITTEHTSLINPFFSAVNKITITPKDNLCNVLFNELVAFPKKKFLGRFNEAMAQGERYVFMSFLLYLLGRKRLLFPLMNTDYYSRYNYQDYISFSFFPKRNIYDTIKSLGTNIVSRIMRLMLSSSIETTDEFMQEDYNLLISLFGDTKVNKNIRKINITKLSAVNNVVALLLRNGREDLEFNPISSKKGGLGKSDGSFYYLSKDVLGNDKMEEWMGALQDFVKYKLDNDEITDPSSITRNINIFPEFIIYRLSKNLSAPAKPKNSSEKHIADFKSWMKSKGYSKNVQAKAIGTLYEFFLWARLKGIWPKEKPIVINMMLDQPRRKTKHKTDRGPIPRSYLNLMKEILLERPPKHYEYVYGENGKTKIESPTKKNYFIVLTHVPLRGGQTAWLDSKKCIHHSEEGKGLYVNTNKTGPAFVIPYLPEEVENALHEEVEWQKKYNIPMNKPIPYMGKKNPRFEPVYPLFRPIGSVQPYSRGALDSYWKKLNLQLEKECNNHMAAFNDKSISLFNKDGTPVFDIHSLRVSGITYFIEAGASVEAVMNLAGHSSEVMTIYYTKIRSSTIKKSLIKAADKLKQDKDEIKKKLIEDMEGAFDLYDLVGQQKSLDVLPPSYWTFEDIGICPGQVCPPGRERRCGICNHFVTGPTFLLGLVVRMNMIMDHGVKKLKQIKTGNYDKTLQNTTIWREAEQDFQEWVALANITAKISRKMEERQSSDGFVLYSQNNQGLVLEGIPEYEFVFHRCLEIEALPTVDMEDVINKAWHLREKLFHSLGFQKQLMVYVPEEKRLKVLTQLWEMISKKFPTIDERKNLFSQKNLKLIEFDHINNILGGLIDDKKEK
jgi:hypothetical protein